MTGRMKYETVLGSGLKGEGTINNVQYTAWIKTNTSTGWTWFIVAVDDQCIDGGWSRHPAAAKRRVRQVINAAVGLG